MIRPQVDPKGILVALLSSLKAYLRELIPESQREMGFRLVSAVSVALLGIGVVDSEQAALWTQAGVGTVTLLFAWLYATSSARAALYALTGPIGGLVMAYGLVNDVKWAVVTAAIGQAFGVTTAAAKVVQLPSAPNPG